MDEQQLRVRVKAKIKAVMYGLIADTYDMTESELKAQDRQLKILLETQKQET